ncbi:hypothetical protein BCR33DRAFT_713170 [Rhizoclosmatium globosum]|uniref:Uncharacterized protein n=1 Tax=Rhizoclosmatium globosum TaxID=329046 RepID=A0A1Y2CTX4_9FUNG|nr:hypothetical protein BCR33DRAFT_713170 [Rhizoclosmatium globosum]|eukprot:ORY50346.1 hypothetical protein BCR33DRAFT_713170 [Rhizoclosmatium globosum]
MMGSGGKGTSSNKKQATISSFFAKKPAPVQPVTPRAAPTVPPPVPVSVSVSVSNTEPPLPLEPGPPPTPTPKRPRRIIDESDNESDVEERAQKKPRVSIADFGFVV